MDETTECSEASNGRKRPLQLAAEAGHVDLITLLLNYSANLLAKDSNGLTAMDLAEQAGHNAVVEVLRKAAGELNHD